MVIYATMGCGKSTLVQKHPERFIDADTILNSVAKKFGINVDEEQKTGYILKSRFKAGLLPQYWEIIIQTSNKAKEYGSSIDVLGANFFIPDIADILYVYPDLIKRQRFYRTCLERGKAPSRRKPFQFKYIEENKYLSDYLIST
jgi:hypothetical protein